LARNLHIPESGDSLRELSEHAIASVQKMLAEWNGIDTIEDLRFLVADKLSVKLEFLRTDADVDRIAGEYRHFLTRWRHLLHADFLHGTTEGLLIDNPAPQKGGRRYLAIIDARGSRSARAYFTAWHELAHLLLCPPQQLMLDGFRRTPIADAKLKDPLESAVDQIAGLLAFWSPIFGPALQEEVGAHLTFAGIERAAANVAPGASLYAAGLAATRLWLKLAVFLTAEMRTKTNGTGLALRVQTLIPNGRAESDCAIRKNMRVPPTSIIARAFAEPFGRELAVDENQKEWEVSGQGHLPARAWHVQSVRRGSAVYAILTPRDGSFTANNN